MNFIKTLIFVVLIFGLFGNLNSKDNIIFIDNPTGEIPGTAKITSGDGNITPIALPDLMMEPKQIMPINFGGFDDNNKNDVFNSDVNVLDSCSFSYILDCDAYLLFEIDIPQKDVSTLEIRRLLSEKAQQALTIAPAWIREQLAIKFSKLYQNKLDDDYAQLILDASDNIKDEVAFCVANMSYQTLTDSRFVSDKEMIIRNAEMIYSVDNDLQYVDIVEHGSIENRDYYTTTKYRIYDPEKKDTVWSEVPKEYYYWYIVHPKMDQEGVYVSDNNNDNSGQRTYGYSWRDFIWNNPDPSHDYTNVNITTGKGSVTTIPVFKDLIKSPRILWNRTETYLPFGREFQAGNSALDVIGNWCSRALPVDVQLPRAFQPNQILMKHNGNCNEDAFLVTATCRTALIPIIYLSSLAEDHVFGAIWDEDWYHFEFFRGGLQVPGNNFFGITNMLPGGSYSWKTSMVEGFRPDGYTINFTKYYADTCHFDLKAVDSQGNTIEGAMFQVFAPYGNGYAICERMYTDRKGEASFAAGEGKQYLVNVYHPDYGWSPSDKTQAYYMSQGNTLKGANYKVNVQYPDLTIENNSPESLNLPEQSQFGFNLKLKVNEIITGISEHDNSQKSRFYKWNDEKSGIVTLFVCDQDNYDKFTDDEPFTAYNYTEYVNGGELTWSLPEGDKWYVIVQNKATENILERAEVTCELLQGDITSVNEPEKIQSINVSPNPFINICNLNLPNYVNLVEIYDSFGRKVDEIKYPFIWEPSADLSNGIFFFKAYAWKNVITAKGLLYR